MRRSIFAHAQMLPNSFKAPDNKLMAFRPPLPRRLKTSGATGFHLYIPVEPVYTYEQLRTFAEIVARTVYTKHQNLVTNERFVARRPAGRVLIDVQQNAHGRPLAAVTFGPTSGSTAKDWNKRLNFSASVCHHEREKHRRGL